MKCHTFFVLFIGSVLSAQSDLYEKLHVSRSATTKEIKAAYRREATKWHPDKNPSPDAERNFVEIARAYEVLTDPQKRAKYDAFGVYEPDIQQHDSRDPHINPSGFFNAFFSEPFFSFGGTYQDKNVEIVTFQKYREKLLPNSRTTPILILGISHFCFRCRQIQPTWSRIAARLSKNGVVFGISNIQDDQALREELNVLHSPSVVAVIDGKVSYFMDSEVTEGTVNAFLIDALMNTGPLRSSPHPSLPPNRLVTPLITTINTLEDLDSFLAGWLVDSRPRAIFMAPNAKLPLHFYLAAYKVLDHYAAALIHALQPASEALFKRLQQNKKKYGILVFHELSQEPVFSYTDSYLKQAILDDILMKHSRLAVPRLLSASRFSDLCPADGHAPSSAFASAAETLSATSGVDRHGHTGHRHLCLLLALSSDQPGERVLDFLALYRSVLRPTVLPHALSSPLGLTDKLPRDFHPILSPAYIYTDRQAAWLRNISASGAREGHLLGLWRISSRLLATRKLPEKLAVGLARERVEEYTEELKAVLTEVVMDMVEVEEYLRTRDARDVGGQEVAGWEIAYLPRMEALIVDELAAPLALRILLKLKSIGKAVVSYFDGMWADPVDFFLTSGFTFVLLSLVAIYRVGKDVWQEFFPSPPSNPTRNPLHPSSNSIPLENANGVGLLPTKVPYGRLGDESEPRSLLLTPSTYDRLILSSPRGQFTLLLCTDASALGQRLADRFYTICHRYSGDASIRIVPACLFMDRYAEWLGWALQVATHIPLRPSSNPNNSSSSQAALTFNPANCRGTVLAVNGFRHYFHIYHPLLPGARSHTLSHDSDFELEEDADRACELRNRRSRECRSPESRRVANFSCLLGLKHDASESDEDFEGTDSEASSYEAERLAGSPLLESEVLQGLAGWIEQVFEGSLRRHRVTEWPKNLTVS